MGGFEIATMQAMEEMQTRLHPPNSSTHFSYNRVPWKLKVFAEHEWRESEYSILIHGFSSSDPKGGLLPIRAVDQPNNHTPCLLPGN